MFILYNLFLTLFAPLWVPWMAARSWRRREAVNWSERQGDYPLPPRGDDRRIWIHAVSVGEVLASLPILRALRKELPKHRIVLSVTTSSGHETARDRAAGLFDFLVYFPIDVPRFQLRAMQRVRPDVVAIMETELWMNFLWAAKAFSARTVLLNGRISDRSFPRARRLAFFYRVLFRDMDRCLMQSATDAERIKALGARDAEVLGNCKFDQAIEGTDADPAFWRKELRLDPYRPVIVVGSLRAEEFGLIAQTVDQIRKPQWIVAPRHLEKTESLVGALLRANSDKPPRTSWISYRTDVETTDASADDPAGDVTILDSYGELAQIYSVADIVVIGGGFAKLGGQNVIQPLAHGKPVLFGRYMANFRDVAAMAVNSGAALVCADASELTTQINRLLDDAASRASMGVAARALVQANVGAGIRYAAAIAEEVNKL